MINGLAYRLIWQTAKDSIVVTAYIWDTSVQIEDSDDPEYVDLIPSGKPLIIRSVNNSVERLLPIRGKQAELQFISDANIDITTFAEGGDNRFYVEIIANEVIAGDKTLFLGYLILDDCSQNFQPNPNVVTLIASDHLALLGDIPWVEDNGNNPVGMISKAEVLALALKPTGLSLPINIVSNLRHGTGTYTAEVDFLASTINLPAETSFFYHGQPVLISGTASNNGTFHVKGTFGIFNNDIITFEETFVTESNVTATFQDTTSQQHYWRNIFINASSHEVKPGESEPCADVIRKLLMEHEFITQYLGEWWVMRIDEFDGNPMFLSQFDEHGTYIGDVAGTDYIRSIGATEDSVFALADNIVSITRPNKEVKHPFRYETPQEVPTNVDFERGELIDTVSEIEKQYKIDSWKLREGYPGAYGTVDGTTAYVTRKFNGLDYEDERYLELTPRTTAAETASQWTYVESDGIPVHAKDKGSVSIDWRLSTAIGTGGNNYWLMVVYLKGDDGTDWLLGNKDITPDTYNQTDYKWWNTTNFTTNTGAGVQPVDFDDNDETEFRNLSWEFPPIPVDGTIHIWLHQFNQDSGVATDDVNIHYANLRFTYSPFINGSYIRYTGQFNRSYRDDEDYIAKREEQVYYSDSPKKLFKGAMFFASREIEDVFKGNARFVAPDSIILESGDWSDEFTIGENITVYTSLFNNEIFKILNVSYSIIGNETTITVPRSVTTESVVFIEIRRVVFKLTNRFYTAAVFSLGNPTELAQCKTFGKQQAQANWNQYRNANRAFNGTVYGLTIDWPDLIHKYELTDSNPNTNSKYFQLIEYEQDWKSCLWRGTFIQVYDSNIGKDYDDGFEFKYDTE